MPGERRPADDQPLPLAMPAPRRLLSRLALATFATLAACRPSEGAASAGGSSDSTGAPSPAAAPAGTASLDPRAVRADTARILGSATAKVWLLEVSDFQCPFCKTWHDQVFPTIVREYVETGKIRLAYVHFPLRNHRHAQLAAEASMCAGAQGAFWPYHDRLFAAQERLNAIEQARPLLDSLAAAQRLDGAAFAKCLDDGAMRQVVTGDQERMLQAGVNATPTFFVGGTVIEGAQPLESFRAAIDAALRGAGGDTGAAPSGR